MSTAFLQGWRFCEVSARAREQGHEVRLLRKVWLAAPQSVWRHLRSIRKSRIYVADQDSDFYVLHLLNAMCGLVDGPLLFHIALSHFPVTKSGLARSLYDEGCTDMPQGMALASIVAIHVDDLLLAARAELKSELIMLLEGRFGSLKMQESFFFTWACSTSMFRPDTYLLISMQTWLSSLRFLCARIA